MWNHWQPVTTALVVPDFDSQLKAWLGSLLGYKPYHYAVVEAPYPSKAACTSMWSTNKVFEPLHMQWMGIWNHWQPITTALNVPDFDSLLKAWLGHCWATNHTILMQWLKLHTHPKLLVHQCGAHKVFEPLYMQWTSMWNHWQPVTTALADPDFDFRL
jgi:hypothetical protein